MSHSQAIAAHSVTVMQNLIMVHASPTPLLKSQLVFSRLTFEVEIQRKYLFSEFYSFIGTLKRSIMNKTMHKRIIMNKTMHKRMKNHQWHHFSSTKVCFDRHAFETQNFQKGYLANNLLRQQFALHCKAADPTPIKCGNHVEYWKSCRSPVFRLFQHFVVSHGASTCRVPHMIRSFRVKILKFLCGSADKKHTKGHKPDEMSSNKTLGRECWHRKTFSCFQQAPWATTEQVAALGAAKSRK